MATFEELTGLAVTPEPQQRPLDTLSGTGSDTRRQEAVEDQEIRDTTTTGQMFGAAWERNITNNFYDTVQRKFDHAPDTTFDPTTWTTENAETIVGDPAKFATVRSVGEAEELRDDMIRASETDRMLAAQGVKGVAAQLLVGMVDPTEIAVGVATAGSGKAVSLAGRVAASAGRGAVGGALAGAASVPLDPNGDANQIIFGALTGAVLSGGVETLTGRVNRATHAARDGYVDAVADLPDASITTSTAPVYGQVDPFTAPVNEAQSLGAASTHTGIDVGGMNPTARSIFEEAVKFNRTAGVSTAMNSVTHFQDNALGRTASKLSDALHSKVYAGVMTDFDRLASSGSTIEQNLAYNLLESAEGRARNNTSAANLNEVYYKRMAGPSMLEVENGYSGWVARNNIGMLDRFRPEVRNKFDREVILELEARYNDGVGSSTDPAVIRAADGIDENMSTSIDIARGRDGEAAVDGFQDLQKKSGYFRHVWSGSAIRKLEASTSPARVQAAVAQAIRSGNEGIDEEMADIVSRAIIRRAKSKDEGIDTNMLSTLDQDASEYLREMLNDSGVSDQIVDRLIDAVRGKREEQGVMGAAKSRTQIDLRGSFDGVNLIDLVDTNVNRVLMRYNRELSGRAALARKGITNNAHKKQVIEAALAERSARGLSTTAEDRQFLEGIFTYFDAGPIAGGIDPTVARMKRVANLALLNQMGLTQLGEVGAQVAAVGMNRWLKHAAPVIREMHKQGADGPILRELKPFLGEVGKDHMLFRDELMMDELSLAKEAHGFMSKLDNGLARGQRAQGYMSGFYHIKGMQQKIAVTSMADKVMSRLRDGVDEAALADIGVPARLRKYIENGTVEFMEDGTLNRLNLERWDAADADEFALALNRHSNQVVQQSMAGEETMWMHKTVGSMYMHLKSFPVMAIRKQALRTVGVSTPLAVATLTMGLATAGLAYSAKQVINGRGDSLDGEKALKGALAMSNMTGWVPMLTDPAAAVLGMNDLKFSQYGRHDISTSVIDAPAFLPTINKMAQLPGAVNPISDLSDNERIRIMQATPLVGNLYGFSYIFNSMKD